MVLGDSPGASSFAAAVLACWTCAPGCSDDRAASGSTAASSTGETGDPGASNGAGSTTSDPPADGPCRADAYPVRAALCGGDGPPCVRKRDELVSAEPHFRNDRPALALGFDCAPQVLFASSDGESIGYHARRGDDAAWTVEVTPMAFVAGDLAIDGRTGEAVAAVDDGAYGVSLWRREGGAWTHESSLAGKNHLRAGQLAVDRGGTIHIAHMDKTSAVHYRTYDGEWRDRLLAPLSSSSLVLGLTPAGSPQVAFWDRTDTPLELLWAAPPAAPEVATILNWKAIGRPEIAMAVAPDGTPWVLLNGDLDAAFDHRLLLLHRDVAGSWSSEELAAEETVVDTCAEPPTGPGETCEYEGSRVDPGAVLVSADAVRALYLVVWFQGSYRSMCVESCVWVPQQAMQRAELRMAWPGSGPSEHELLAEDVTSALSAQLDLHADIHLAFYETTQQGSVVRYLEIGP